MAQRQKQVVEILKNITRQVTNTADILQDDESPLRYRSVANQLADQATSLLAARSVVLQIDDTHWTREVRKEKKAEKVSAAS